MGLHSAYPSPWMRHFQWARWYQTLAYNEWDRFVSTLHGHAEHAEYYFSGTRHWPRTFFRLYRLYRTQTQTHIIYIYIYIYSFAVVYDAAVIVISQRRLYNETRHVVYRYRIPTTRTWRSFSSSNNLPQLLLRRHSDQKYRFLLEIKLSTYWHNVPSH